MSQLILKKTTQKILACKNNVGIRTLLFWYEQGEVPEIRYKYKNTEPVFEVTRQKIVSHFIPLDGENKHKCLNMFSSTREKLKPFFGQVSTTGEGANKTDGWFSSTGGNFKNTPIDFPQPGTG